MRGSDKWRLICFHSPGLPFTEIPTIQLLAIASKFIHLAGGKNVLIRNYVLGGKDRDRFKCALHCFLVTFKYNEEAKVYIYGNKALFGFFIFKINRCNVLHILVYYKAVLRQV